ncbi:hypothetical protein HMI56_002102 [Coelomomyces lativittatus]|nr:hypothetical protein HMI56_002102 [Coelomomyces lativittatus]
MPETITKAMVATDSGKRVVLPPACICKIDRYKMITQRTRKHQHHARKPLRSLTTTTFTKNEEEEKEDEAILSSTFIPINHQQLKDKEVEVETSSSSFPIKRSSVWISSTSKKTQSKLKGTLYSSIKQKYEKRRE